MYGAYEVPFNLNHPGYQGSAEFKANFELFKTEWRMLNRPKTPCIPEAQHPDLSKCLTKSSLFMV